MQYTININQYAAIESGLDVDMVDVSIIGFISLWSKAPKANTIREDDKDWVWCSPSLIVSQLPLMRLKDGAVRKRLARLESVGLVHRNPRNEQHRKCYLRVDDRTFFFLYGTANDTPPDFREGVTQVGGTCDDGSTLTCDDGSTYKYTTNQYIEDKEEKNTKKEISVDEKTTTEYWSNKYPIPLNKESRPLTAHPSKIVATGNPPDFDLWWGLYGVNQGQMNCEAWWVKLSASEKLEVYGHTWHFVPVTEKVFRSKPLKYLRGREWQDEIIDRRDKKDEPKVEVKPYVKPSNDY